MPKKIIIFLLALTVLLIVIARENRVIGSIKGAEWQRLVVGDTEYAITWDSGISWGERGRYLGKATDGRTTFRVFAVKGDAHRDYLYCLWDWEGRIYEKQE